MTKQPDSIAWFDVLKQSTEQVRQIRAADAPEPKPRPVCRCGATEIYGRPLRPAPRDLTTADVEALAAPRRAHCRACPHAIQQGQMCIRWVENGSAYTNYYHRECVEI